MRRLRRTAGLRRLVRETTLDASQLIWPLFIQTTGSASPVESMPGVYRHPLDTVEDLATLADSRGLGGVLLFGLPDGKDELGRGAYHDAGVVQEAVRRMKASQPNLTVVTDVCLCAYTSHGHCGVLTNGVVDNDASLELLAATAVSHAKAGADVVAPSDMMDGRVGAIRDALDGHGLQLVPVMSYAAKYASAFYGPFREAADSSPEHGDRRGYQMDPANSQEALREIALDLDEGADIVMVKPGLPYLDVIQRAKEAFGGPVAAYQVSGEYSKIKMAGAAGAIDERLAMREAIVALRRAGADIVITYDAILLSEELEAGAFDR
jgi:porphobilinogen synthase